MYVVRSAPLQFTVRVVGTYTTTYTDIFVRTIYNIFITHSETLASV